MHQTRIPATLQVTQMVQAIGPLARAGVLRTGTPVESWRMIDAMRRWGMSLAALIEMACASFPDRIGIADDQGTLTFSEIRQQSRTLAQHLSTLNIADLDSLALVTRNGRGLVLPLIASAYLGVQPKILNPGSSPQQIHRIVTEYKADVVFVDAEFSEVTSVLAGTEATVLTAAPVNVGEDCDLNTIINAAAAVASVELPHRPAQRSTVIMSSGTYGVPKAVVLPVPRTPKVLGGILDRIPWRKNGVVQLTAGMFHAWGWLNLHIGLATGSTLVLRRNFDEKTAADDIEKFGVTGIVSAAVFLRQLLEEVNTRNADVSGVKFIVSAGNAIPPELVTSLNDRFGADHPVVHNFYGSTEHGQIALSTAAEMAKDPRTAGRPGIGVRLAILDDDGKPVPAGTVGAIYSANSMTSLGFLSDRDSSDVIDGLLATGDKGFIDSEGRLYVAGRADDMVIKGGENVHPREVEEFLRTCAGIQDVFVIGIQDDIVARVDAYIIAAPDATPAEVSGDALRTLVRGNLAAYNVPDRFLYVDELPRNDSGKVVPRLIGDPLKVE